MENVTLRQAQKSDLAFLFKVSTIAMRPVVEVLNSVDETLSEYESAFEPENIQVIQYNGIDVGRLRVVKSDTSIYIGGLQILPEYQRKGIGSAILERLVGESKRASIPITLEVHDVNLPAKSFYKKFGFVSVKTTGRKSTLQYLPISE